MESQFIYRNPDMKARLIRRDEDWFVGEYKTPEMSEWFPWICGTREWLCLSEQEVVRSVDKRGKNQ